MHGARRVVFHVPLSEFRQVSVSACECVPLKSRPVNTPCESSMVFESEGRIIVFQCKHDIC